MRSDGLTTDGVHLNERGNRFVADLMLEHLELYHLAEDPLENVNLAQHPEQVDTHPDAARPPGRLVEPWVGV